MKQYFKIINNTIFSVLEPGSKSEAWDKTLEKWRLLSEGNYKVDSHTASCGLCDYYARCSACPIEIITDHHCCLLIAHIDYYNDPSKENAKRMHKCLKLIKEKDKL